MTTSFPERHQMFATSLANGLLILKSFTVGEPALSNREFAVRTGLSKATVSRLTYTLEELGFLKYDTEQRRYRLGSATLSAAYPLLANLTIRQVARPFMKALADLARGSVSLGMRDRCNMVYIETCRGHEALGFRPDIGGSLPLLATAMGRAWLAGVSEEQRRQALKQIQSEDPGAWKKHGRAVQQSLRSYQANGACFARGDWQLDVHAVAVPMQLVVDGETLVFNCGAPAMLLDQHTLGADLQPKLVRMVRDVEHACLAQQNTAQEASHYIAMSPYEIPLDKLFASTLARGLELLLCFRPGDPLLGNKEFAARTGFDNATVSRLTYTLAQLGYLRHDTRRSKYRLGASVLSMAYPLLASMKLRQIARPLMNELANEMRGSVSIAIRDRADMIIMDTCRSEEGQEPLIDIGASMPLLATATGRAWFARADLKEREVALNQTKVRYPQLFTEHAPRLPQALRDFASCGYCTNPGYSRQDRLAVAIPMAKPVNSEIVVFNCAVPASPAETQEMRPRVGSRLVTLVRSVEVALGLR